MTKRFHLSHLLPALWLLFTLFACEKQEKVINKPDKPNQGQTVTPSNPNQTEDLPKVNVVVTTLQKATIGKGYNIVLMGIGFSEDHIRSGAYDRLMKRSHRYLFSMEPMNSLRAYFNVYAVHTKVQDTLLNAFVRDFNGERYQQPNYGYNANLRTFTIASAVPGFKKENSIISVVVNTKAVLGLTYMTDPVLAYAYSALSGDSMTFRGIMLHETVGHGIGKLADEDGSSFCGSNKDLEPLHKKGWYTNISLTNDPEKVPWAQFLKDKRYATGDLYVYERHGCSKYTIWSPTKTSTMGGNGKFDTFNAPSRRAIYDHVMQVTTGRTPTYEEFVQFDLAHRK